MRVCTAGSGAAWRSPCSPAPRWPPESVRPSSGRRPPRPWRRNSCPGLPVARYEAKAWLAAGGAAGSGCPSGWSLGLSSPPRAMLIPMNRRDFVKATALLAASPLAAPAADGAAEDTGSAIPEYQKPVFNLPKHFPAPVKIAAIDLLQSGRQFFVRTRSTDGVEGIVLTKD